jgi:hypothetical protein
MACFVRGDLEIANLNVQTCLSSEYCWVTWFERIRRAPNIRSGYS